MTDGIDNDDEGGGWEGFRVIVMLSYRFSFSPL